MPTQRALHLYRKTQSDSEHDRVQQHAPLVRKIAYHLVSRLPASVEVDDLIQVGLMGLMEAARNFDPNAGVQFETFATQRIRGAMLDELRSADWMPRQARRNMREIEAAVHKLEQALGRAPQETEVAQLLGIALEEYQLRLGDARGHQLLYYDDFDDEDGGSHDTLDQFVADHDANPLESLSDAGFRKLLVAGLDSLPEREKLVMALYYDEELNLKEIGAVLGVSESRVSQLHSQAIARLRSKVKDWLAR
ncbi:RNA polymerase, sigma 28 subunit, SigD/FliA/WhiG [Andreprevotia lacus DSM 23236]|jgi:RNA polymerase sigma factor for flagellar operon FliA|uniref:RNA polymerase sigma factor FliA n=1 Tax=Andreprevotia lacus DSM 23236 TaxID=1121001 RepID=A0A1W1XRM6_9NEIS|nr:RNA polymerase sigma factor FliA [Andreprevotia lacus]SMC26181.1 RNA polymerase, sigma 28 subunit, SigD/FliA/WhiG [Andreprevotia lacus DSM 23236]